MKYLVCVKNCNTIMLRSSVVPYRRSVYFIKHRIKQSAKNLRSSSFHAWNLRRFKRERTIV